MNYTAYPAINALLDRLIPGLQTALGADLIGLYLYGSAVTGDFDDLLSDIDLLAALERDIDPPMFARLDALHTALTAALPVWENRIEIAYMTRDALASFRERRSPIGIISPGEPFHIKDAGMDWLMNWYLARSIGVTLTGAPPETCIPPIPHADFIDAAKAHVIAWGGYFQPHFSRPYQGYAILTMCRGVYTVRHGEQVSKQRAAAWAQTAFPQWAGLIGEALEWRTHHREPADPLATAPRTRAFIDFMIAQVT
ncbi:MAG: DUF4111 domain-containing protein [bacterium]|nr:DUF4111 domain-containing protein [bacterium]